MHCLIPKHVFKMPVKLKFECERLKEATFCSGGFELVSYWFLLRPIYTMQLVSYDSFFLYYPETKEMIYDSVNLKGVLYKPKQNSFSLQSSTTYTGFANVGPDLL